MYNQIFAYYQERDELGKLVIIDLLDEIIEFSPKYRRFKDTTHKKVLEWKTSYIFPIAANEAFGVNWITFYSKRIRFNKELREYLLWWDQSIYYNLIRHSRFIFLELLANVGLIKIFHFSEEAKKEVKSAEMEELYSIKDGKAYFELPKFQFSEKWFSIDENETILMKKETEPLYLLAKETDKFITSQWRNSLEEIGRSGTFLEELDCLDYICDVKKLEQLKENLKWSETLQVIKKCTFWGDYLYINGDEVHLAEKSQLFIKLLARYFWKHKNATQVDSLDLLDFYRKNKDDFARLDIKKLNYKNIKNWYFDTLERYIRKYYVFEEILTIEQKGKAFTIKKEKIFS